MRYTVQGYDGKPEAKGTYNDLYIDIHGRYFGPDSTISYKFYEYGYEDLDILLYCGIISEVTGNTDCSQVNTPLEKNGDLRAIVSTKPMLF